MVGRHAPSRKRPFVRQFLQAAILPQFAGFAVSELGSESAFRYLHGPPGFETMGGMNIGYARVSTEDQTLDLQRDALQGAGCDKIFAETASGANSDRPVLQDALTYARAGDTLVVWRLDRLGRSLPHLLQTVTGLADRGDRLPQSDRGDRHDHPRRQADLPRLRRPGRVRARPDPRTDHGGAGGGARPRAGGGPPQEAGRAQAARAGAGALCQWRDQCRHHLPDPGHLPRHPLPGA